MRRPGPPLRAEVSSTLASRRLDSVSITTESGLVLECLLSAPRSGGRWPAVILVGGYRTGRRAAALAGERFSGIAFACDYPWRNPGSYSLPELLARLPRIRSALVSTPHALRSATTWLLSRPDVDSSRVAAVGASLGVPFVIAWAADDGRVGPIALLYGGAPLAGLLDAALRRSVKSGLVRGPLAGIGAAGLRPLEPGRHAAGLGRHPTLVIVAADDERIPAELGENLGRLSGGRVVRVAGRHLTPNADSLLALLTDTTAAWLDGIWGGGTTRR